MMSPEEIDAKLRGYPSRKNEVTMKIAAAARAIIPVLKDAGRLHSAAELDALFFELDVIEQEMIAFVAADPQRIIARVIAGLEREGRR